jgi:hypothetical protein
MLRRARPLRTLCWTGGEFPERKMTRGVDFWWAPQKRTAIGGGDTCAIGGQSASLGRCDRFVPLTPYIRFSRPNAHAKRRDEFVWCDKVCLSPASARSHRARRWAEQRAGGSRWRCRTLQSVENARFHGAPRIAAGLVLAIGQDLRMPVGNTVALDGGQSLKLGQFPGMSTNVSSQRIREFGRQHFASLDALCRESKCSGLESSASDGHSFRRLAYGRQSGTRARLFSGWALGAG